MRPPGSDARCNYLGTCFMARSGCCAFDLLALRLELLHRGGRIGFRPPLLLRRCRLRRRQLLLQLRGTLLCLQVHGMR